MATALRVRMPAAERARLADDDELNQQQAAFYLGIGRSTLAGIPDDKLRKTRLSPRNIRYRVADLRSYEQSVTTGPAPTTTHPKVKK